jgi:hypothetical protein
VAASVTDRDISLVVAVCSSTTEAIEMTARADGCVLLLALLGFARVAE